MSTTCKYNFVFILPNVLEDIPIPFDQFKKPLDDEGNETGHYSHNEYVLLPNKAEVLTPSGTHKMLGVNATSILSLAIIFPQFLTALSPTTQIVEGIETDRWLDETQDNYLWIVTTDPVATSYNYDAFKKVSPLFKEIT